MVVEINTKHIKVSEKEILEWIGEKTQTDVKGYSIEEIELLDLDNNIYDVVISK